MPVQDEPAGAYAVDVLAALRGAPTGEMTTFEIALTCGIEEVDCRLLVRRLLEEGWILDNGRKASARRLRVAPHEPRETDWSRYPRSVRRRGVAQLHVDGPPPKVLQVVRDSDKNATAALTAWLVDEVKRDPIAAALRLASTAALEAEISRRNAGYDALVEMGLPPAE